MKSSRTPAGERVQNAVDSLKPGRVFLLREASFHLNAVHLVLKHPVAQSHLVWDASVADEQQVFQVGVE